MNRLALAAGALVLAVLALAARVWAVLPWGRGKPVPPKARGRVSLGVFLGSGGHTAEMRTLLRAIGGKYAPRVYVYCAGDEMSLRVVAETEARAGAAGASAAPSSAVPGSSASYSLLELPRARRVGQGRASSLLSGTHALLTALWYTFFLPLLAHPRTPWVDVLLLNGPGTAVVLVLAAYVRRILGLRYTRIIYVESFARVTSLSLSGRLLRPLVDTFVVQWPDAAGDGFVPIDGAGDGNHKQHKAPSRARAATTYRGWLV